MKFRTAVAISVVAGACLVFARIQFAQPTTVEGTVIDAVSREQLSETRIDFESKVDGIKQRTTVQSDGYGRFHIDPKGADQGVVVLSRPGYSPLRRRWPSKRGAFLVAEMDHSTPMSGAVTSSQTSAPLEGTVSVIVARVNNPVMVTGRTQEGLFSFPDLPPGEATVWARAKGMAPSMLHLTLKAGQPVENMMFRLQQAGSITGHVRDATGKGTANASIKSQYEDKKQQLLESFLGGSRITNADGEFRLNGIVPGQALLVHAETAGRASQTTRIVLAEGEASDLAIGF